MGGGVEVYREKREKKDTGRCSEKTKERKKTWAGVVRKLKRERRQGQV